LDCGSLLRSKREGVAMKKVLYSPELDVVVISHGWAWNIESQYWFEDLEWSYLGLFSAMCSRPEYKGCADIADLFDWVEIGEFE
jgi:hypothetical protein